MGWITPKYSKTLVDKAGASLVPDSIVTWDRTDITAFDVIGNWRSSHGFALNNYQNIVRAIAKRYGKKFIVAQRLKRIPSIIGKLEKRSGMRLTQIQDIGGCRVVVSDMKHIEDIKSRMLSGKLKSKYLPTQSDDYIENPKDDGYRCIHYVFKYQKTAGESLYNNQRIEVQIRTVLQHSWATALESVDIFRRFKLKSGDGPNDWKRFFALTGNAFSEIEKTNPVSDEFPTGLNLKREIRDFFRSLNVEQSLLGYKTAVTKIDELPDTKGRSGFVLIRLNFNEGLLHFTNYSGSKFAEANAEYLAAEAEALKNRSQEVALVSTDRIEELRKAYPNYYMDTDMFISRLKRYLGRV